VGRGAAVDGLKSGSCAIDTHGGYTPFVL
jgi:hypothetical protein